MRYRQIDFHCRIHKVPGLGHSQGVSPFGDHALRHEIACYSCSQMKAQDPPANVKNNVLVC
jgi:hypothetical protein